MQIKSGAYVPAGTTPSGSVVQIVETDALGMVVRSSMCTTSGSGADGSFCTFPSAFAGEYYLALPGDTVTLTQTAAASDLTVDPVPQVVSPCAGQPPFGFCGGSDVVFSDNGPLPSASDDSATVRTGNSVDVDVLANDSTHGAPTTALTVSAGPAHGTATVQDSAAPMIKYTPAAGFIGTDHFSYRYQNANGSATGTVTVTVTPPPPTAKDDTATTASGKAVSVDVTANDDANRGGLLTVQSATDPAHGSTKIDGTDVVYTPKAGFAGTDHFSYTISTPYGTDTGRVAVTVAAPVISHHADNAGAGAVNAGTGGTPADTGVPSGQLLEIGIGLLVAGAGATTFGRRRRVLRPNVG